MERLGAEEDAGSVQVTEVAQGNYCIHGGAAISFSVCLQMARHVSSSDWPDKEKRANVLPMVVLGNR